MYCKYFMDFEIPKFLIYDMSHCIGCDIDISNIANPIS